MPHATENHMAGWRLNDIRLAHDTLGVVCLQVQFRRDDTIEFAYQMPLKFGESMAATLSALAELPVGISEAASRYSKWTPPQQ